MDNLMSWKMTAIFFLGTALVLHIVCLASPYYFGFAMVSSYADPVHSETHQSLDQINFGMWKFCYHDTSSHGEKTTNCLPWGRKTVQGEEGIKTLKTPGWMRAGQAMAILGLIFHVFAGAGAGVSVVVKSKGDRIRCFPLLISSLCGAAALFIFIGEIVMVVESGSAVGVLFQTPNGTKQDLYRFMEEAVQPSWGFGLDMATVFLTLAAAVVYLIIGRIASTSTGSDGLV